MELCDDLNDLDLLSEIETFTFGNDKVKVSKVVDHSGLEVHESKDISTGVLRSEDFDLSGLGWQRKLALYSGLKLNIKGPKRENFLRLKDMASNICGMTEGGGDGDGGLSVACWQFPPSPLYIGTHTVHNHIPNKMYDHSSLQSGTSAIASAPDTSSTDLLSTSTTQREIVERHRDRNRERVADRSALDENIKFCNNCPITETWGDYSQATSGQGIEDLIMCHQLQWQAALYDLLDGISRPVSGSLRRNFYAITRSDIVARSHRSDAFKTKGNVLPSVYFFRDEAAATPSCIIVHAPQWFVQRLEQLGCGGLKQVEIDTSNDLLYQLYQRNYSDAHKSCKSFLVSGCLADVLLVVDALQECVFQRLRGFVNELEHTLCIPALLAEQPFVHATRRPLAVKFLLAGDSGPVSGGSVSTVRPAAEELSLTGHVLPSVTRAVCEMVDTHVRRSTASAAVTTQRRVSMSGSGGGGMEALLQKYTINIADTQEYVELRQKALRRQKLQNAGGRADDGADASSLFNLGEKAAPAMKATVRNPMAFVGEKLVWGGRARRKERVAAIINGNKKRVRDTSMDSEILKSSLMDENKVNGQWGDTSAECDEELPDLVVTISLTPLRHDTQAIDSFYFFSLAGAARCNLSSGGKLRTDVATVLTCSVYKTPLVAGGVRVKWEMKHDPLDCVLKR